MPVYKAFEWHDLGLILLQVSALQKEIADIDKQVTEAERMLKFADPGEH